MPLFDPFGEGMVAAPKHDDRGQGCQEEKPGNKSTHFDLPPYCFPCRENEDEGYMLELTDISNGTIENLTHHELEVIILYL